MLLKEQYEMAKSKLIGIFDINVMKLKNGKEISNLY